MRKGQDIAVTFPGLFLVHHNLPGSVVPTHAHPEHHLIIPLQGEIGLRLEDGRDLVCGPGRMAYVSPKTPHEFRSAKERGERLIAMLDPSAWKKAAGGVHGPQLLPASQLCKELLFHLLLHPESKNAAALIDVFARTIQELLVAGAPAAQAALEHAEGAVRRPELRKAIELARASFADEDFTVAELARRAGVSSRNLSRMFEAELGLSPKQLLVALKIEKAKELLRAGGHTVTEAAFAVGYGSLSPFIAAFRQITGELPSEFLAGRKR